MKALLIAGTIALAGLVVSPATASAELYQYVSCTGSVKSVNADTTAQALQVADLAIHSGVVLVSGSGSMIPASMIIPGVSC
jgi:hypothetical protein